jgi:hypothetical protein
MDSALVSYGEQVEPEDRQYYAALMTELSQ